MVDIFKEAIRMSSIVGSCRIVCVCGKNVMLKLVDNEPDVFKGKCDCGLSWVLKDWILIHSE